MINRMRLDLTVLRDSPQPDLPTDEQFARWAAAALGEGDVRCSLAIRIVDEGESRRLNREFRHFDRPTNVLSFTASVPEGLAGNLGYEPLGDLAICAPLVEAEARAQLKPPMHHWAHLTVHGVLHLLGHDHGDDTEAREMEELERHILERFGIPDPYRPQEGSG